MNAYNSSPGMFLPTTERESFLKNYESTFNPSNSILPEDEQEVVQGLISESQRTLDSLDDEISAIQTTLRALLSRREQEALRTERLRTGVAPHKKIPLEVLSLIFIHTISDRPAHIRYMRRDCPWNIGQVCSRWRATTLSEARLWNTMIFKIPEIGSVFQGSHDIIHRPVIIQPHRFHEFIEHLHIESHHNSVDLGSLLTPFSHSRNLKEVLFSAEMHSRFWIYDLGLLDRFPWAQLTSLMLLHGETSLATFTEILRRSVNLAVVNITLELKVIPWATIPMLKMRHLRVLEVHGVTPHSIDLFLSFLVLPSLKTLCFYGQPPLFRHRFSFQGMAGLITRSGCSLTHVVIQTLPVPSESIELCLPLMPELVTFSTDFSEPIAGPTLDRMRWEDLVPKLESFSAGIASFDAFRALLKARYKGLPSIRNRKMRDVNVRVSRREFESRREEIMEFVEEHQDGGRTVIVQREESDV